jgi:hypothetical protein
MLTQKTAQNIYEVCDEINSTKSAIYFLSGDKKPVAPIINVAENTSDDGITVVLVHEIAKEALEKQLKILEAEYAALNKKAIEEVNSNENCTE